MEGSLVANRVALGETRMFGEKAFVASGRLASEGARGEWIVWTPIPDGMTAKDLGHLFDGAETTFHPYEEKP